MAPQTFAFYAATSRRLLRAAAQLFELLFGFAVPGLERDRLLVVLDREILLPRRRVGVREALVGERRARVLLDVELEDEDGVGRVALGQEGGPEVVQAPLA